MDSSQILEKEPSWHIDFYHSETDFGFLVSRAVLKTNEIQNGVTFAKLH